MSDCVHWWYIDADLHGVCRKCGAKKTFRDPMKLTAKEYLAMRKQAMREVAAARRLEVA